MTNIKPYLGKGGKMDETGASGPSSMGPDVAGPEVTTMVVKKPWWHVLIFIIPALIIGIFGGWLFSPADKMLRADNAYLRGQTETLKKEAVSLKTEADFQKSANVKIAAEKKEIETALAEKNNAKIASAKDTTKMAPVASTKSSDDDDDEWGNWVDDDINEKEWMEED